MAISVNGQGGGGLPSGGTAGDALLGDGTWAPLDEVVVDGLKLALTGEPANTALVGDGAGDMTTIVVTETPAWVAPARASLYQPLGLVGTPPTGVGPHWGDGCSLVLMCWATSTIGAPRILLTRAGLSCHLRLGDHADAGRFGVYYPSSGLVALPADCTVTGGLEVPHVLAMACTGGNLRVSWDGGTVGVVAVGSAVAPSAGAAMSMGADTDGTGYPPTNIETMALRMYSTVLSDGDLVAAGQSAVRTAGDLPTLTGTMSFDFNAKDAPPFLVELEYGDLRLSSSTIMRRRTR